MGKAALTCGIGLDYRVFTPMAEMDRSVSPIAIGESPCKA
ncbi:hypothetical protein BRO54_2640 [Geobacillus proteiniphilus]|uniref:Uncharacterized protein n=1 Tax=Geobacillus proteiniphilus TaxID=860353 RepID=A0A1Q5SU41_9BACL|nr:hypothetical protein BRO54_2640 [Geobacillus proteiniphilus]